MKLLVTGAWGDAKTKLDKLRAMGHEVLFLQQEKEPLPCAAEDIEGVICNGLFLYHKIEMFTKLRYIQLTSAGFDRVPMDYIREHHIEIRNARGVYSIPMAEYAVGGILQLYKQARFFTRNQQDHRWEKHRGLLELSGKTVLIAGCGSVGTECAKRLKAFDTRVIGTDLFPREDKYYDRMISMDQFDTVLPEADILIMTLPLTRETEGMLSAKRFNQMKQGAVLVSISRGAVIREVDLIQALQSGALMGAVLDVFEEEPLNVESALWKMENVILTPHNSFVGEGNQDRLNNLIMRYLEDYQNERK